MAKKFIINVLEYGPIFLLLTNIVSFYSFTKLFTAKFNLSNDLY